MKEAVKIIITGDTHLGGGRVTEYANRGAEKEIFGEFLPMIRDADLSITNLESPVIDGGTPILKTGPTLKSPVESLNVLKDAGFGLVTLANNHIMDYGREGLQSTLEECQKAGIESTGAGRTLEDARKPYLCKIGGIRLSVINVAENEFGTTDGDSPGCHPLDPVQNFHSIREAKKMADHVVVIVHGGHEHYELPSPRMKKTYRFFADAGASAVIAHHTHCPCGYEVYNGIPICYSLGNFLFDLPGRNNQKVSPWNEGLIAELNVTKHQVDVSYQPFIQNFEKAGLRLLSSEEQTGFDEKMGRLNRIISDDERLKSEFENYCSRSYRMYSGFVEPHSNRILHALRNRNIIPSLLSEKKKRLLLNLTRCEAHRDVLIKTLTS
jgi:poly-gamma-glutamate capsule biosynthesis protein CapA/YwtB (metallophosphatase superfamily)